MNRSFVSRIAFLVCFLLCAAMPSFAGDKPLALPQPADSPRLPTLIPAPIFPVEGQEYTLWDSLQWTHVNAPQYRITFIFPSTGAKFHTLNEASSVCENQVCSTHYWNFYIAELTRDGETFKWQVTAEFTDEIKIKADKASAVMNEVDPITLLSPAKGYEYSQGMALGFSWTDSPLANTFTITVKDKATGQVAFTEAEFRSSICNGSICTYITSNEDRAALQTGHTYVWKVKSNSETSEKAKSKKWKLTVVEDTSGM